MAAKASLLFAVALLLAFSTTASAFNITKILGDYPEYGALRDLLSQTKINVQISTRQVVTLLALDNDTISSISNRSLDEIRKILMNHVVLDYFDTEKIRTWGKKTALLTTLYQTTGVALNQQGFINMTRISRGNVAFGPANPGAPLFTKLLGQVLAQPFNLSILQVSTPIISSGFGDPILAPPPPPASPPPAPAPKKAEPPSQSDDESDDEEAAPGSSPSPAPGPAADAPSGKKASAPKAADDDEEEEKPSASSRVGSSSITVAAFMGLVAVASLVAF
ncbi:hypothetical protein CCACVL1_09803 [Corchorus capsularis]|uniref:FAS1 domain-containing protein n=1 Tax=Corchorus capsularis TaxID=210143 RepID=A0A1R3IU99_COCAP|nr:hypothetical protein CCACVL1_09803 [Corchorus capsularis]